MTTNTGTTPSVDDVLATLQQKLSELNTRRTQAQHEITGYVARMQRLEQRISTIQVATTALQA